MDDRLIHHEAGDRASAEHLRRAFEELGTLFIKLGQMLSTRADLLPEAYRTELSKLQDDVPPLPAEVIAQVIEEDLGRPAREIFASFDSEALGSASIGQVHAARLRDGREVVIKVRKPGVDDTVRTDLQILGSLIEEWSPRFPVLSEYGARALFQEFSDVLTAELDFGREASNARFFREVFGAQAGFSVPEVIDAYTRGRVLVEERLRGRRPSELRALPRRFRDLISRRIARFVLEPAFEHGVFYADPHPGNFLVQEDGVLGVVDFGKVGRLAPENRQRVADLFVAVTRADAPRLADRLIEITAPSRPIDRAQLTSELQRILALYVDVALETLKLGDAVRDLLALVRRHGLRLPGTLMQFFKALTMCEGVLQALDPESSFADYLRPMAGTLAYQALAGPRLAGRLRDSALDAADLVIGLPHRIDRVLGELEGGALRVWARIEDAEALFTRLERLGARLNATIFAAACIVGLSVVLQFYHPRGWEAWIGVVFWTGVGIALTTFVRFLRVLRR